MIMVARLGRPVWIAVMLAVLLMMLSVLVGLATNSASSTPHWPGPLDLIRQHPWWTVLILGVLALVFVALGTIASNSGPAPVSNIDLVAVEERLYQHLDTAETGRSDFETRTVRLPPRPRTLLAAAGDDRDRIWKAIASFTDDAVDPVELSRQWAASLPVGIEELPVLGLLVVAELLCGYGHPAAAVAHLRRAVDWGATPRAYWLVRMAQIQLTPDEDNQIALGELLDEAAQVDGSYPLVRAMRSYIAGGWSETSRALEGWCPTAFAEQETAMVLHSAALVNLEKLDDAIRVLNRDPEQFGSASILLRLAQLLRVRAVHGTGDSAMADATRAVEVAIRARNLRRIWRSDSAEAVAIAAEAAVIADDPQQVWTLTQPTPAGEATVSEAADPRVLPAAAIGAVLTGRFASARELAQSAPEGYLRLRIKAELASADSTHTGPPTAVEAWRATLMAATTDEERLHALRGLAMEGTSDSATLDELRTRYPDAVADIDVIREIASIAGSDADERLRELETRNPLATVRRAELHRHDDPAAAAELLINAHSRWRNPRLLLLALDCYQDAGQWDQAEQVAQDALVQTGQWSGRVTVLRRLVDIQTARNDWRKAATTCRVLLEIDLNDEKARWVLAYALYREGESQQAWQTLQRASTAPNVTTTLQARLLLDLSRRYAEAIDVARTALAMLQAFPDDQDVHAAVIGAVTLRADRADLPDDIGSEVTAAWQSFLDRYPDSDRFTRYTLHDDGNPLADIEELLRQHASTYIDVLDKIREQQHPIGMLELVVGKPYSAIFPYRPLGYHRITFPGDQDNSIELSLARASLATPCLVAASVLYTLTLVPNVASTLIALLSRPSITDAGLRDLAEADDMFGLPKEGTLTYDAGAGQVVVVQNDADVIDRQRAQIGSMLATAHSFRRLLHPALVHLRSMRPHREPTWALTWTPPNTTVQRCGPTTTASACSRTRKE
jgi:tetratricopeptide (TPR) repeat protein